MSYQPFQMYHNQAYHSALEEKVGYAAFSVQSEAHVYHAGSFELRSRPQSYQPLFFMDVKPEYAFMPEAFLRHDRPSQPFVGDALAVERDVKKAFWVTTGKKFPSDIRLAVLDNHSFNKQVVHPVVVGFSLNRKELGMVSDVVVRAGAKDHLMLTIGHEIGHVLSKTLPNKHHEEAKAFAFSRAWMTAIRDKNIAGLRGCIILDNPAQNGLHDVSSAFVWRTMAQGHHALELYWDIVAGRVVMPLVI